MDKVQLLQELDELNRLLNNHAKNQCLTQNYLKCMPNGKKLVNKEGNISKPAIFLNIKKLNSVYKGSTLNKQSNHDELQMASKVFINPNFRKSGMSSLTRVSSEVKREQRLHFTKSSDFSLTQQKSSYSENQPLSSQKQNLSSNHDRSISQPKVSEQIYSRPSSKSLKIFFNPEFSSSSKNNTHFIDPSLNVIGKEGSCDKLKSCDKNLVAAVSSTKVEEQKFAAKVYCKRKVIMNVNKSVVSSINDFKIKKAIENNSGSVKKIFVNPNFGRKGKALKTCAQLNNVSSDVAMTNSQTSSSAQTSVISSPIPVLIGGKEVTNKITSGIYPLCTVIGVNRGNQDEKKSTCQRIRTQSSSLITVSRTKLIRKDKLKHKTAETSERLLSQPLFVSKTKLVRNLPKNIVTNMCLAKMKAKLSNQKLQTQLISAGKLLKLRRRSLSNQLNLSSVVQKPGSVTKIKSSNGKSLKLIRKNTDSSFSATKGEKPKTPKMLNTRKMELRQQANRVTASLLQYRLKRNQFSKINVPIKVSQSPSCYNNIYKKNNLLRAPLTKAALIGKRETVRVKYQARNNPLDVTKFIRSKYRLVRKTSTNTVSRFRANQRTMRRSRIMSHYKMVQRKKLKWKSKSNISKRRLTRKDLSIKKIGGVFYRYSRTTLSKHKSPSKTVLQLQNKRVYEATSVRRQNRYSINKYPARKRLSITRGSFTASPFGMTWKRTDYGSPRSILTQANKKSVYLLSKKLRKNNEPCLFFHRLGQCSGYQRGTCVRLHDKKYVAVCKKFLQGSCTDDQCRLSHAPSPHNLPTCLHFLAGHCGRDNCVYPHIKVSDSAPVCLDFLKGYCILGDQCFKRHFEICPSFEKGICARGKYCPYPHPKNKKSENLKGKFKHIKRKPQPPKAESVSKPSLRYFEDVSLQKENEILLKDEQKENEDGESEEETEEVSCLNKRPKLGDLPSFIPLSQSFQAGSSQLT